MPGNRENSRTVHLARTRRLRPMRGAERTPLPSPKQRKRSFSIAVASTMKSPSVYSCRSPVPSPSPGQNFLRIACEVHRRASASIMQKAAYSGRTPSPPGFSGTLSPAARGKCACPANALSSSRRPVPFSAAFLPPEACPFPLSSPGSAPGRSGHTECISLPRNHGRAPSLGGRFRHEKPVSYPAQAPCFAFSGVEILRTARSPQTRVRFLRAKSRIRLHPSLRRAGISLNKGIKTFSRLFRTCRKSRLSESSGVF